MHAFANPARFLRIARPLTPVLLLSGLAITAAALVYGLFYAPAERLQGETVRILFIHVPTAWLGMAGWSAIAVASLVELVWRHPLAALAARGSAVPGAVFAAVCLATGSLWGRPTWGTYWVWDARLTSMLVLLLLYLGVIALYWTAEDPNRGSRAAAVLTLVGALNLPIIKFSVDWWNTLHQPASILRMGGSAIDSSILIPLLVMAVAFTLLFATLHLATMRNEILRRRVRTMQLMQAQALQEASA